jgi:hypothetical protein
MGPTGTERRGRGDTGATLTEYAMIVAVVVALGAGTTKYLQTRANAQVAVQADCISTRPPPQNCQPHAVVVTTTVVGTPTTPPVQPPAGHSTWTAPTGTAWDKPNGTVQYKLRVQDSANAAVAGARVFIKATGTGSSCNLPGTSLGPYTTDASGFITVTATVPKIPPTTGCTQITLSVVQIDASISVNPPAGDQVLT